MAAIKDKLKQRATVPELAQIIERSEQTVRQIINALGLKRDKQSRYLVSAVIQEHVERQKRDNKVQRAMNAEMDAPTTWADKLKAKQIEKLEVQIDALKGEYVTIEQYRADLNMHANIVKGVLENFVQWVSATKSDSKAVKKAQEMQDKALAMMREEIENAS